MVKIRLTRMGRHKAPYFRIVVTDSRTRRDGDYIELVGTYEPFKGDVKIDENIALNWLNKGAQPTDTVRSLLRKAGVIKKYAESKNSKKVVEKKEVKTTTKKATTATKKTTTKKASTTKK